MKKILHYMPFDSKFACSDAGAYMKAEELLRMDNVYTSNSLVINHARLLAVEDGIDNFEVWFYDHSGRITEAPIRSDGTMPAWPARYNWEIDVTMKILKAQKERKKNKECDHPGCHDKVEDKTFPIILDAETFKRKFYE